MRELGFVWVRVGIRVSSYLALTSVVYFREIFKMSRAAPVVERGTEGEGGNEGAVPNVGGDEGAMAKATKHC